MNRFYRLQRCPWLRFFEADTGGNATGGAAAPETETQTEQPAEAVKGDPSGPDIGETSNEIPPSFDKLAAPDDKEVVDLEETPKGGEEKPPEVAEVKPEETPLKPEAVKPPEEAAKPAEQQTPTGEEIEAMQPPPGSSAKTITHFGRLKSVAKTLYDRNEEARLKLVEAEKQIEELKKTNNPVDPEKLAELKRVEFFYKREKSPEFQAELKAKYSAADASIMELLKGLKLSDEAAKEMLEGETDGVKGLDRYDDQWWTTNILGRINSDIAKSRVTRALEARADIEQWRKTQLESIPATEAERAAAEAKQDEEKVKNWSAGAFGTISELSTGQEWSNLKEAPANATEDQKKAIETHNAATKQLGEQLGKYLTALHGGDPKVAAEVSFRALECGVVKKENATLKSTVAEMQKRIDDFEALVAKSSKVGKIAQIESAVQPVARKSPNGIDLGESSSETPADFSALGRR